VANYLEEAVADIPVRRFSHKIAENPLSELNGKKFLKLYRV